MFSKSQIRKLHMDFISTYPDPTEDQIDRYFNDFFCWDQRQTAYSIWNKMFLDGSFDNPKESKETGAGSKWVPDYVYAQKALSLDRTSGFGNIVQLLGYKDWARSRVADPALSIKPFVYPDGGTTISGFMRSLGFERQKATNYFWEKDKPHNHRVIWDNNLGLLIFEKMKGVSEALEGVYNNMEKNKALETEEAFEEDMCGMEAMDRSGLENLQAILATQLSEQGSIQVLENLENGLDDPSTEFTDQLNFIKNTVDLSDTQEVLTQIMSAAETLLDDVEMELLTESLSEDYLDEDEEEGLDEFDGEEYEEPDDWSTVDEDMPTDLEEQTEGENGEPTGEEPPAEEEPEGEAHESLTDGKGNEAPATEEEGATETTNRYSVRKYGQFLWSVVDSKSGLFVRKPGADNSDSFAYGKDGKAKFYTTKSKEEAQAYADKLNGINKSATEAEGEGKSMNEEAAFNWLGQQFEKLFEEVVDGDPDYNKINEAIATAPYDPNLLHWIWDQVAELGDDGYDYDEFVALCGHYPGGDNVAEEAIGTDLPDGEEAEEPVEDPEEEGPLFEGDVAEYLSSQPGEDFDADMVGGDERPISGITGDAFEEEGEGSPSVEELRTKINQLLTDPQFKEDLKAKFREVIDPILGDDAFDEEDLAVAADEALEVTLAKYGVEPDGDQWDILSDEEGKLVELEDQVCTELYGCTIDELLTDEEEDAFEGIEVEGLPENCEVTIMDDTEEVPYLAGYMSEGAQEIMDGIDSRSDLDIDQLWATGWTGIVQNEEEGPFNSFEEMDIICYDDEKEVEYPLPELPEQIKSEWLQAVNNYITHGESEYLEED